MAFSSERSTRICAASLRELFRDTPYLKVLLVARVDKCHLGWPLGNRWTDRTIRKKNSCYVKWLALIST